ncbi:hypothetical protein NL676_023493 [Syzygium grande]|nr:hypothetical protein NL676_023493 [Syzygium grande]
MVAAAAAGGDDRLAVVKFHEADPSSWPELVGSCDGLVAYLSILAASSSKIQPLRSLAICLIPMFFN